MSPKSFILLQSSNFHVLSALREKSNQNFDAAKTLMDNGYLAPSIHCSYYSCFQLLKYSINFFFGIEYSDLSSNIASSNKNTHRYIIDYVYDELSKNVSSIEARNFKREIKDLKFFREESDYEVTAIQWTQCNKAYNLALNLRGYLIKTFHV